MLQSTPAQPVPRKKIWTVVYTDSETECFEIRTLPEDSDEGFETLFHKEYTIGTAIGDFLEVDLSIWNQMLPKMQEAVQSINEGRYLKKSFNAIFYCTLYWLDQSAFFAPFAAALQRLHIIHGVGDFISLDECNEQMAYYKDLQQYLRDLIDQVFSVGEGENTALRYFALQQQFGEDSYPPFAFDAVQYLAVPKGVGGLYAYDEFLEEDEKRDFRTVVTEVLETEDPEAFGEFLLYRYLQENLHLRKCKYCSRYFATLGHTKLEYCDRLIENSTKTCREMGSLRLYEQRKMEDPAIREYKRSYKTHNARIRYGLMTREEFTAWSVEARKKRDACSAGELPLEEFVAWLNSDKPQGKQ
ncbi:MAG: hypothetical protein E7422_09690 [Ruminococcaceae bacterium]|nr:hypothetical protein [Oscillospiraceae bacterium]